MTKMSYSEPVVARGGAVVMDPPQGVMAC